MRIIGLRVFHYAKETQTSTGTFETQNYTKHILCAILDKNIDSGDEYDCMWNNPDKTKIEIELSQKRGMCYSGWTTASWGIIKINKVKHFHGITHFPKEKLVIDDMLPDSKDKYNEIKNQVFSFFHIGENCCDYYPEGEYKVNMDLFEASPRYKENRQVYIFTGPSGAGKSFLAHQLKDLTVYETDSKDTLPNSIIDNVVVIGNKYDFSVDDVKSRLFGNPDVHIVTFT